MLIFDCFTALSLGVMTAIHPCLIVLNMMALTAIYGSMESTRRLLTRGCSFVFGRITTYTGFGFVFVTGSLALPQISRLVKYYTDVFIGPIFIIIGMLMADMLFNSSSIYHYHNSFKNNKFFSEITQKSGLFFLGVFHTVLFCPVTAGLFFGVLIPLADNNTELLLFCFLYGIGSGIPLLIIVIITISGKKVLFYNNEMNNSFFFWYPKISGSVLVLFGIYLTLTNIFHII